MSVQSMIEKMAKDAKAASSALRKVGREEKDAALALMARKLDERKKNIRFSFQGNKKRKGD